MNNKDALSILELDEDYTLKQLKRAYYKKCLMYHPDKNPNGENEFKQVKNAYDILIERYETTSCGSSNQETNTEQINYFSLLQKYISILAEKYAWDTELIMDVFRIITNKKNEIAIELLKRMKKETMIELFELLHKYKTIFKISDEFIEQVKNIILERNKDLVVYELNPSICDLFENNVYVFEYENKQYYIPLWHSEVYFDKFIFIMNPELPNHITIDDENNVHIYVNVSKDEIFENKTLDIELYKERKIQIETCYLYCRKKQIYTLIRRGINKINEKDIFNTKRKSDVLIHIEID